MGIISGYFIRLVGDWLDGDGRGGGYRVTRKF